MGWQNTILYIRVSLHLNRNSTFKNSLCVLISFKIPKALLDFTFTQILPLETTSLEFSFYTFMTFSFLYLGPGVSQFLTLIVFSNVFFSFKKKGVHLFNWKWGRKQDLKKNWKYVLVCVYHSQTFFFFLISNFFFFLFSDLHISDRQFFLS